MKILFINLPYHGHVIPTIGLVQELIKAGHQVTYLMPYDWEERIADSGAEFLGYESNPQLDKQIRNAFFKVEEVIASHELVLYEGAEVRETFLNLMTRQKKAEPENPGWL